ncbi:hypothetical protein CRE_19868 [Caenorhabditis remanei]|uniref:F-box domain-containing protein n=1 Tax=Caenorhabditis remanei TaxID=31234 RepID=E3MTD5_CAERE|nr:hypothetical protein CRE_19868 [Caenorhabditis remanei]
MFIKKILTTSRIFESISINFEQLDKEKVKEIFGQIFNGNEFKYRYVRVPNSKNQVFCTTVDENCIEVARKQDKYIYDYLPSTDEPLIPFEDCNDWSKTLANKTIMELLLNHLGFIEIQTLRKVCSNIRTCIDHFKPNRSLTKLGIDMKELWNGEIDIKMEFLDGSYRKTTYAISLPRSTNYFELSESSVFDGRTPDKLPGCTVGGIFLPNRDMFETCLDDLKTIVPRKNFYLEEFEFAFMYNRRAIYRFPQSFAKKKKVLVKLEKLLNPNNVLMKARKFKLFAFEGDLFEMPEPILWLEPISLELIEIHSQKGSNAEMNKLMKLIMDTNQWKYAKEYVMKELAFLEKVNIIHFVHFSKIGQTKIFSIGKRVPTGGDNCDLVCFQFDTKSKLENSNFVSVFCDDLGEILLQQTFAIYHFSIIPEENYICPDSISSQILSTIMTSLSLKSVKVGIAFLRPAIFGFEQVMNLLSHINPKSLRRLILKFSADSCVQEDIENVFSLERWSAFKNLHFDVNLHTVSEKELLVVKKILTTSRIFKCIRIHYEQLDKEKINEILGPPRREHFDASYRYTRVPNSKNLVLHTTLCENILMTYWKPDKEVYNALRTSDEDLIPLKVCNNWSKTLENKTIIELLLDHLGFIEIQTHRKVCSNIRTCIDHFKPNPNLTKLGLSIKRRITYIQMGFKNGSCLETRYSKVQLGCRVGNTLVKQDMYKTCLDDLKTSLSRKKINLEEFEFAFHCNRSDHNEESFSERRWFIAGVRELLTPNNVLMKVRKFIYFANCLKQDRMVEPIQWLEPISLELIETHSDKESDAEMNKVMKLIMDTNQWQYAKEYLMKGFVFLKKVNPIHFVHFSKIDITVENWTNEDFFNWQEVRKLSPTEILYSPSFLRYKISFRNCSIDNDIYNLLGLPYRTVNGRTTWYFKMPEKNLALHVLYYASKSVIFTRVDIEDVPEVIVMNFDVELID